MDNISFPVPKGFTPPEGVAEGDTFDFMASGYFKGPTMYLSAVEGVAVSPGKEVKEEAEEAGEEMGMVEAVEQGMA
jgi:tartrate dehydratase beta subunit/fumarate hydratase class I family protein